MYCESGSVSREGDFVEYRVRTCVVDYDISARGLTTTYQKPVTLRGRVF